MMKGLSKFTELAPLLIFTAVAVPVQAEKITVSLSQEQDGGTSGRACMYLHKGKAEYVIVQPEAMCPSTVTLESNTHDT